MLLPLKPSRTMVMCPSWSSCVWQDGTRSNVIAKATRRAPGKRVALILLGTVISLTALAKKNQYLPRTDPGRHVSKVSKMVQSQREALVGQDPLDNSPDVYVPIPTETSAAYVAPRTLSYSIAIVLSAGQLRSPPFIYAN
jgi:hypothetical protein